jgi:transcriptional regulator GlxA family with amidase domain
VGAEGALGRGRKLWTSSGVSAGIDMALALIARLVDAETADLIAHVIEYTRHADPDDDPFA